MKITTRRVRYAAATAAGLAGWGWLASTGLTGQTSAAATITIGASGVAGWHRWRRHHRPGMANAWQVWRSSGAWAMRRRAKVLRPSLAGRPLTERWRVPLNTICTPLCKVGRQTVYTSVEESTLRIGIPGVGKSAELACKILDAPGAVVVTSTATDLHDSTWRLRAQRGKVHLFNPGGLAGLASTLRWSPLSGCQDPDTASRRAADLMGPPEDGEGKRWHVQAQAVLVGLLHAAALVGARMRDVQQWVADPDTTLPLVVQCLATSPQRDEMIRQVANVFRMNQRTRDGVLLPLNPVLSWLSRPVAAACGDPSRNDDEQLDIRRFVNHAETLYLLGDDDGALAPLVGALTAEIAHQARHYAATLPGGRLDPALTLILDEVALICPVPLDRWLSELRKRNIIIHAACQGLGQLRQRWGKDGASMILNSARAVLLYGGAKDADDLAMFAALAGDRDEKTGDGGVRRVPVIEPSELSELPDFHVLVIRRGMPVALGRTPQVWRRRDVKKAGRAARSCRQKPTGFDGKLAGSVTANPRQDRGVGDGKIRSAVPSQQSTPTDWRDVNGRTPVTAKRQPP